MTIRTCRLIPASILLVLLVLPSYGAQGDGPGTKQRDKLEMLDRALEYAGAPPLDETQRQAIDSLIDARRAELESRRTDRARFAARDEMEQAILSGNEAEVSAAADRISSEIAARAATHIRDAGIFKIRVLKILTEQQVSALKTQYGESGLVHILGLGGGWFKGHGHGMHHHRRGVW